MTVYALLIGYGESLSISNVFATCESAIIAADAHTRSLADEVGKSWSTYPDEDNVTLWVVGDDNEVVAYILEKEVL